MTREEIKWGDVASYVSTEERTRQPWANIPQMRSSPLSLGGAGYRLLVEADGDSRSGIGPHLLYAHHRAFAKNALVTGKVRGCENYAYSRSYGRLEVRVKEDATFAQIANHANVCPSHGRALHFSSSMHESSRAGTRNNVASAGENHSNRLSCTWEATL